MKLIVTIEKEGNITWYVLKKFCFLWYEELVRSNDKTLLDYPKKQTKII